MTRIPSWQLYGEASPFPDLLHIERIADRAAGVDWRIAPHRHANLHQIFLIITGEIDMTVDGSRMKPRAPVVLNIPSGVVHGFTFAVGTAGHVLTIAPADFPELFGRETEALLRTLVIRKSGLGPAFARIAKLHAGTGQWRLLRLRAAAVDLACALCERAGNAAGTPPMRGIPQLEALIRSHLADGWRVADYASALGRSERQLRRVCLEATGLSALGFIEATRIREACRLLAYTRMQVQEVGFALGIDDPAYFARSFRRSMGLSPAGYRSKLSADLT